MSKRTHTFNWILDPGKFISDEEAKKLLETAKERAQIAVEQGRKTHVRDYFIVDLAMSTGLRVMEMALLACGDIFIQDGRFSLLVRRGKNGKRRLVRFNSTFKDHYEEYIEWKKAVGEACGPRDPLLLSSNTGDHLTTGRYRRLSNEQQLLQVCLLTTLFTVSGILTHVNFTKPVATT